MIELPSNEHPVKIECGNVEDVLKRLPSQSMDCIITSPPYWGVRDYGMEGQIGSEMVLDDYIARLASVFSEARRTLRDDGTLWLNIGNTYTSGNRGWRDADDKNKARAMSYRPPTPAGLKPKDLIGVAWKVATALQEDGWFLRNDIIWHKPNSQPESVKDRFTVSHEYIFLFSKSKRYRFNQEAASEPTVGGTARRNRRSVWSINTDPFPGAHFAVFPRELVEPCILAATDEGGLILDPFFGSGTVGVAARDMGRRCMGIELNPDYVELAANRMRTARGI